MNTLFLLIILCISIQSSKENEMARKVKYKENLNMTIIMPKRKVQNPNLDVRWNDSHTTFSDWSSWTRCENCIQIRTKKCTSRHCTNSRIYEEKPCMKKKCTRQRRRKGVDDMHVVRLLKGNELTTRTMQTRLWSKWSRWSNCTANCRTRRYRICKQIGRCRKQRQVQSAYCYHENSKCERHILNFMSIESSDLLKYEYNKNDNKYHYYQWKKKCGRPLKKSRMLKIIGGTESKRYKWPWHVAVLNRYMEVFCAGTLIEPRWVLTAGHCLRSYLKVRFNEHDLTTSEGREEEMTVQRVFLHPQFNHFTVDNDIALLRLPRPVKLPVACLPTSEPVTNEYCYIMGWGKEKTDDIYGTNKLHEAQIPVVNSALCKKAYRNYIITGNMFCAGLKSGSADTCAGDSGGGLMCPTKRALRSTAYTIQGITSFGDGCGRKNKYGIYTKVKNYLKWIDKIISNYS